MVQKKILITGGCGYTGSQLVESCLSLGHKVWNIDLAWFGNPLPEHPNLTHIEADIRNLYHLELPKKVDIIFHLANIANDPCGELNSQLTWEVNALASQLLAEYAINAGNPHFIYASSGSVYGVKTEEKVTEELSLKPISDYNKSKMVSERVLLSYQDHFPLTIIRPASVCGLSKRMRLDLVVNMLTMQALCEGSIRVLGGDQIRPSIHIQDLVRVYEFFAFNSHIKTGIYNAGFENTSILALTEKIVARLPKTQVLRQPSNDPRSYRLCSEKLIKEGFQPKLNMDAAIEEIISAYQAKKLRDDSIHYNIRTMISLLNQNKTQSTGAEPVSFA